VLKEVLLSFFLIFLKKKEVDRNGKKKFDGFSFGSQLHRSVLARKENR